MFRAAAAGVDVRCVEEPASAGMLTPWPPAIVADRDVVAVPVRPDASAVISGTSVSDWLPRKLTVRVPVPVTATSSMFDSASSAASISVLASGDPGIGAVV